MTTLAPFTPDEDAVIAEMRAARLSWRAIGTRLGRSHVGCRRRWVEQLRHQGGRALVPVLPVPPPAAAEDRGPLPAGSDASWQAITAGTVLDGMAYP